MVTVLSLSLFAVGLVMVMSNRPSLSNIGFLMVVGSGLLFLIGSAYVRQRRDLDRQALEERRHQELLEATRNRDKP